MKLTIASSIKREIAEAVLRESEPGYHGQGRYYAVSSRDDGLLDVVRFKETNAMWDPWHDNATAIAVGYLVDDSVDLSSDEEVEPEQWDDAVNFVVDFILDSVDYQD
jgi:hypothetical protein